MTKTARLLPKNLTDGASDDMSRPVHALTSTAAAVFAGIYIGAAFNLEGYLGIILSIATLGFFIIQAIEDKNTNQ